MKEWHSEHHANLSPFSQRLMESSIEAIYLSSYEWKVSLQVTLDFFFFVDVDVAVFSTCSESYVITIIIDHKKQRCHDDGAVYFMHSMAPCILQFVIMTVTGSSC